MSLPEGGATSSPLTPCPIGDDPFSSISINSTMSSSTSGSLSTLPNICAFNYPVPLSFSPCCATDGGGAMYVGFCTQWCYVGGNKTSNEEGIEAVFQQCVQAIVQRDVVTTPASESWGNVSVSCKSTVEEESDSGEGEKGGSGEGIGTSSVGSKSALGIWGWIGVGVVVLGQVLGSG